MPDKRPPRSTVESASGLKPVLKRKSRARREQHRALMNSARHLHSRRNDLLPLLIIDYVPIDSLRSANRRVRRASAAQDGRISASIAQFGVCQPILVNGQNQIVHGHGIWEAAQRMGLSEVPVIVIDHLTPAEIRLLSIALNRIGETGEWDEHVLCLEVQELLDLREDVIVTGFEPAEIDGLLLDEDVDRGGVEEDVPALRTTAVSEPGDLWHLGPHRLLHGNALDPESYVPCLMMESRRMSF
jgi:ParB-like chromosome segregation protein Spo0J